VIKAPDSIAKILPFAIIPFLFIVSYELGYLDILILYATINPIRIISTIILVLSLFLTVILYILLENYISETTYCDNSDARFQSLLRILAFLFLETLLLFSYGLGFLDEILLYIYSNLLGIIFTFVKIVVCLLLIGVLIGTFIKSMNLEDKVSNLDKQLSDVSKQLLDVSKIDANISIELKKQLSFLTSVQEANKDNFMSYFAELKEITKINNILFNELSSISKENPDFPLMLKYSNGVDAQSLISTYAEVASEFSHTIKTPLSTIDYSYRDLQKEMIKLASSLPEQWKTEISELSGSFNKANSSIELIYKILEEGAGFIPRDPFTFLLQDMVTKVIRIAKESKQSTVEPSVNLLNIPMVEYYWLNLFIAIMQIIENAFEALYKNGKINIYGNYISDIKEIEIFVSNNGEKIPHDKWEKVFERGVSTKGDKRGSGLNIAKRCLERINGEIKILESDGIMTTFCIKFKPNKIITKEDI
jgi:signal transduction histidine kinase